MTFLTPFALFGLIAATIPILLHFFNLRKLRTIEFSTLSFLKELQKTKIRRLKLRQLLLLVLRVLLIILIVLTFARPTLKGSLPGSVAERAKTTAVIILDDSPSMNAVDEKGELLSQAKNAATAIVNLLKDGDEVFLVKLSDVPTNHISEIPPVQHNLRAVRNEIDNIKSSFIHRKIEEAFRYSAKLLSASRNFNKEVYILSDFQTGSFEYSEDQRTIPEVSFSPATQFFLIPFGQRELKNVAIEAIQVPNAIFEVNKPFIIKTKIANYGPVEVRNHIVSIFQDGSRVAQKGIDIAPGQSTDVEFTIVPKHTGYLEGMIELEDDDLEFDNRRYFTVRIPDEIKLLVVGNQQDLHYIRLALATRLSDSSTALRMTETTWDRFSTSQIQNADVIIFSNPHELIPDLVSSCRMYLQNGGGLLLFPGVQSMNESFNTTIAQPLGISTLATHEQIVKQLQNTNSFVEFDKIDYRHPIFSGMFDIIDASQPSSSRENKRTLESPRVNTVLHFIPSPHSQVIMTLTNGYPFLIEERIGNGHILIVSVAANTTWSDLPLKGFFVPLVHRCVAYLAQPSTPHTALTVGEEIETNIYNIPPTQLTIMKPGGIAVLINSIPVGNKKIVRFAGTDLPGIYLLKVQSKIYDKYSVNVLADESKTTPVTASQRERLLKRLGIALSSMHIITQPQNIQHIIMETRLGTELWRYFLIAALFIAILEMFIARESKRAIAATEMRTE